MQEFFNSTLPDAAHRQPCRGRARPLAPPVVEPDYAIYIRRQNNASSIELSYTAHGSTAPCRTHQSDSPSPADSDPSALQPKYSSSAPSIQGMHVGVTIPTNHTPAGSQTTQPEQVMRQVVAMHLHSCSASDSVAGQQVTPDSSRHPSPLSQHLRKRAIDEVLEQATNPRLAISRGASGACSPAARLATDLTAFNLSTNVPRSPPTGCSAYPPGPQQWCGAHLGFSMVFAGAPLQPRPPCPSSPAPHLGSPAPCTYCPDEAGRLAITDNQALISSAHLDDWLDMDILTAMDLAALPDSLLHGSSPSFSQPPSLSQLPNTNRTQPAAPPSPSHTPPTFPLPGDSTTPQVPAAGRASPTSPPTPPPPQLQHASSLPLFPSASLAMPTACSLPSLGRTSSLGLTGVDSLLTSLPPSLLDLVADRQPVGAAASSVAETPGSVTNLTGPGQQPAAGRVHTPVAEAAQSETAAQAEGARELVRREEKQAMEDGWALPPGKSSAAGLGAAFHSTLGMRSVSTARLVPQAGEVARPSGQMLVDAINSWPSLFAHAPVPVPQASLLSFVDNTAGVDARVNPTSLPPVGWPAGSHVSRSASPTVAAAATASSALGSLSSAAQATSPSDLLQMSVHSLLHAVHPRITAKLMNRTTPSAAPSRHVTTEERASAMSDASHMSDDEVEADELADVKQASGSRRGRGERATEQGSKKSISKAEHHRERNKEAQRRFRGKQRCAMALLSMKCETQEQQIKNLEADRLALQEQNEALQRQLQSLSQTLHLTQLQASCTSTLAAAASGPPLLKQASLLHRQLASSGQHSSGMPSSDLHPGHSYFMGLPAAAPIAQFGAMPPPPLPGPF
ncbi:hypothetical protein HaLaN_12362 [Haematococcus lacustris]|uniref:BZIP domain-containing protein n=1 Tax=Haematococcus lacustris TaxID=44745 RepID=A0A699ZA72_HAELA|nr:hypothetical protein HaLaN_12362 [Haematococcus lacustris]